MEMMTAHRTAGILVSRLGSPSSGNCKGDPVGEENHDRH
jgi:hypothetical protein